MIPHLALVGALMAVPATPGYGIDGAISPGGLRLIGGRLPSLVPRFMDIPSFDFELAQCVGGDAITWTQNQIQIELWFDKLDVTLPPEGGRLRLSVEGGVRLIGQATVDNPYSCAGQEVCTAEFDASQMAGTADLVPHVREDRIDLEVVDFALAPVVPVTLAVDSQCRLETLAAELFASGRDYLESYLVEFAEKIVTADVVPSIAEILGGFLFLDGQVDFARITARVDTIDLSPQGVALRGQVDFYDEFYPPDACVGDGGVEPLPGAGPADLSTFAEHDVVLAFDVAVFDDLVYHMWRKGLMCLTDAHLIDLGFPLEVAPLASVVPGFPPGTQYGLRLGLRTPPRLRPHEGSLASLVLEVRNSELAVVGTLPDGTNQELLLSLSADVSLAIRFDALTGMITARADGVDILDLEVESDLALDGERLALVMETAIIPEILTAAGELPLFSPVMSLGEVYIVPRSLRTSSEHLLLAADLYVPDLREREPPRTITYPPEGPMVRPALAYVRLSGEDNATPEELLRYDIEVDGVPTLPTFGGQVGVGTFGESGTYHVKVRAVDLADNVDPDWTEHTIRVDGLAPVVRVLGEDMIAVPPGAHTLTWRASDDLTDAAELAFTVELYRFTDQTDMLSAELEESWDLAPGAQEATVTVKPGHVYTVRVVAADAAGNRGFGRVQLVVQDGSAGCGQIPSPMLLGVLFILMDPIRRRYRSARAP